MTPRKTTLILAGSLMLAPLVLAQDHAVPRGGGGGGTSGGSSSGAHPGVSSSGGGSSSGSHSSGGSGFSGSGQGSSSGSYSGSGSTAERRHPRAGTGTGGAGYFSRGYSSHPYYDYGYGRYYYPGWGWGSYWWPYGSYGWYGGYWGQPYGWGSSSAFHYVRRETGAIRVLVDPSEARVYVDGYYAGVVDDYDGLFQRLHLSPGRHEIAFKLEGYQTHRMKVYVTPDKTLKLHFTMVNGSGETSEDLVGNLPEPPARRAGDSEPGAHAGENAEETPPAAGQLSLTVRPGDASVYVDGAFRGTAREVSSLQLSSGRHRVEVVRPGYKTVEREIELTAGGPVEVAIELEKSTI